MNKKWFFCPVCGWKLAKTDEKAIGGVYAWCKYHRGEVEVKHQTDIEQQEILKQTQRKQSIA